MIKFFAGSMCLSLVAPMAAAQEIGIQFWDMKPGTKWVTETLDEPKSLREETFLGQEGDFYITEMYRTENGERKFIFKNFYDAKGRRVRGERDGAAVTYEPFQCRYTVGDCTHHSSVPHYYKPSNDKYLERSSDHKNRLEGDTFYLGWVATDGSVKEFPFVLGKYNLRVGQKYKNNLGDVRGFKLIELVEP